MHFSKILITTDLSPAAEAAFELAAYDRKMEGSEIFLLHVCSLFEPSYVEGVVFWYPTLVGEYGEAYRKSALSKLQELAAKHFHRQEVRCEAIIPTRGVAEEVCAFAKKKGCDLIVMGSRGHTVLGSLIVGSVAQRTLLLSECPVLVVPPRH